MPDHEIELFPSAFFRELTGYEKRAVTANWTVLRPAANFSVTAVVMVFVELLQLEACSLLGLQIRVHVITFTEDTERQMSYKKRTLFPRTGREFEDKLLIF
jgi:hypothetical protein